MEKFTIGENRNESIASEIIHRTEIFVKDSNLMLAMHFLSLDLISKMLEAIISYKDVLEKVTPKNDDEIAQVKSILQDLIDLETACHQRMTLH